MQNNKTQAEIDDGLGGLKSQAEIDRGLEEKTTARGQVE